MLNPRLIVLVGIILGAAALRLIPHPFNVAPITAVALFSGAHLSDKRLVFLIPLLALFLSDLVLGFYPHMEVVYGSFALVVGIGMLLRERRTPLWIACAALTSSLLFFIMTNFGVWVFGSLYPKTIAGLIECYVAALPFFQHTLMGDAFYTAVLFGGFALAQHRFPILREPAPLKPQTA